MADLKITPTRDGGEITIVNGKPEMTDGLFNAVYLSIFTGPWWGNLATPKDERYTSTLPQAMNGPVTVNTRNDVIESVRSAIAWLTDSGIADEVIVEAEIEPGGRLDLRVKIVKPENIETYAYALNWNAQEVEIA
ncbi:hypothetical protein B4O97_03445 [Marispirochaeta aestuarii]|uniref:IraD/Gp25-like domain-containing protein n=1 Tax=Marispirochaeta aestuarii TaxID=1963862 RepID=A0A1Y1S1E8_9SPIO|nr:phage GP46 family protein [Marispirochaeta aestuarii]ORC37257.1 hypothetical protein B4O97_03445 [Marispirochaeta aestuarii]